MLNSYVLTFGALLLCFSALTLSAQDDLMDLLDVDVKNEVNMVPATFKGSRLINGHTIMTRRKGTLEFLIAHRFGRLNAGIYELFGIDDANVRFGLDYALSDRITIGGGRNSFEKTYDGFVKIAFVRQQYGKRNIPFSVTGLMSTAIKTLRPLEPDIEVPFSDRLSFTYQMLIASKISEGVSIQLMPSLVHFNIVEQGRENDLMSLGVGGRFKLTKRLSLNTCLLYTSPSPRD